jgi:hypothetical protein
LRHFYVVCGAFAVFIGVCFKGAAFTKHRAANDPPDEDYQRRGVVRRRRFDLTPLELNRLDVRLDGGRELAESLNNEIATLAAMLRSFERAMAAAEAGADYYVNARLQEARKYATWTSSSLHLAAETLPTFADSVERVPASLDEADTPHVGRGGRLVDLLPEETLALLYRVGVRFHEIEEWDVVTETGDVWGAWAASLRDAQPAAQALAQSLEEWSPRLG